MSNFLVGNANDKRITESKNNFISPEKIGHTVYSAPEKVGRAVTAGVASLGAGALSLIEGLGDFAAGTALQIAGNKEGAMAIYGNSWSGDLAQKARGIMSEDWRDTKAAGVATDITYGLGNALAQVGIAFATAGVANTAIAGTSLAGTAAGATAVKAASMLPLFMSATASGTGEAVQITGEIGAKENIFGILTGATELATETIMGAGGKLLKGAGIWGKAADEATKSITRHAVTKGIFSSAAGEFFEEATSALLSTTWKRATGVDKSAQYDVGEALYQGMLGSVSGAFLGTWGAHRNDYIARNFNPRPPRGGRLQKDTNFTFIIPFFCAKNRIIRFFSVCFCPEQPIIRFFDDRFD